MATELKRAFLVVGPEASGNRYLTRLLVSGGCAGAGDYHQPFDLDNWHIFVPSPEPQAVVVCRSFPHAREWPCLVTMLGELAGCGYTATVLPVHRRTDFVLLSQVRAGHVASEQDAQRHYDKALELITDGIAASRAAFLPVCYDWLGKDAYRAWLASRLGLELFTEAWIDGDAKY